MSGAEVTWLSTKAAADYLGVTARTLYRMIDEGQVPAYKFGRVIRLKQSDVDAFVQASRIQPGTLKHLYPDPRDDRQADDEHGHTANADAESDGDRR